MTNQKKKRWVCSRREKNTINRAWISTKWKFQYSTYTTLLRVFCLWVIGKLCYKLKYTRVGDNPSCSPGLHPQQPSIAQNWVLHNKAKVTINQLHLAWGLCLLDPTSSLTSHSFCSLVFRGWDSNIIFWYKITLPLKFHSTDFVHMSHAMGSVSSFSFSPLFSSINAIKNSYPLFEYTHNQ